MYRHRVLYGDYAHAYHMGDPGLFGFLGKAVKGLLGAVPIAGPLLEGLASGISMGAPVGKALAEGPLSGIGLPTRGPQGQPIQYLRGGAGPGGGLAGLPAPPSGFLPGTVTTPIARRVRGGRSGAMGRKRRRMRVTNVKALNRAARRVEGFAHLARKVITLTRHVRVKHARRRRRVHA